MSIDPFLVQDRGDLRSVRRKEGRQTELGMG